MKFNEKELLNGLDSLTGQSSQVVDEMLTRLNQYYGNDFVTLYTRIHLIRDEIEYMLGNHNQERTSVGAMIVHYCIKRMAGMKRCGLAQRIKRETMANSSLWYEFVTTHPIVRPDLRGQHLRAHDAVLENMELANEKSDQFWGHIFRDSDIDVESVDEIRRLRKSIKVTRVQLREFLDSCFV